MPNAPKPNQARPKQVNRQYEQRRGSAASRGYDGQWNKYKAAILADMVTESANPYCRYCESNDATQLDHVIPPSRLFAVGSVQYQEAFWDVQNLVPCCGRCNSEKRDKMPEELRLQRPEMWARLIEVLRERGMGENKGYVSC
jgi:5-methylcytosine-specific restriction enzyme A